MTARSTAIALTTLLPGLALAHPGHTLPEGLIVGALHPVTGIDHLVAMLAVGLWAAQLDGRLRWAVPMSFVTLLLIGAMVGMSGVTFGAVEQGIAASVCVLGMLSAGAKRLPAAMCLVVTGSFALFHGYAHGAEAPQQVSAVLYMSGFALSTAMLHLVGFMAGSWLVKHQKQVGLRWVGAAMAVGGLALFAV